MAFDTCIVQLIVVLRGCVVVRGVSPTDDHTRALYIRVVPSNPAASSAFMLPPSRFSICVLLSGRCQMPIFSIKAHGRTICVSLLLISVAPSSFVFVSCCLAAFVVVVAAVAAAVLLRRK